MKLRVIVFGAWVKDSWTVLLFVYFLKDCFQLK